MDVILPHFQLWGFNFFYGYSRAVFVIFCYLNTVNISCVWTCFFFFFCNNLIANLNINEIWKQKYKTKRIVKLNITWAIVLYVLNHWAVTVILNVEACSEWRRLYNTIRYKTCLPYWSETCRWRLKACVFTLKPSIIHSLI